jgi:trigger factor
MQVSLESQGTLGRRMSFTLPAERLGAHIGGRLQEIARTARLKGFRPGKVPAKFIEQRFGKQVHAEALESLLRETFDTAVRENELILVGNPQLEATPGDELAWVATFEVVPDFGEVDVAKLNVIRHASEVTDADIDRMVENLRQQRHEYKSVARAAQAGDRVALETWSQAGDERLPVEGVEKGATIIGSGVMFAQIENALVGMDKGEQKEIDVDFPADWRVPQLAGRQVKSHVKVTDVAESTLPQVDKAFIKSFGVKSGDAEQFRAEIRSNLERELKGALANRLRREVGEQIIATWTHVEMPPKVVESEARAMLASQVEQAQRAGQNVGEVPADAHLGFMDAARKRVLVGLLVGAVARQNQLRLDPKRLNETMRLIASTYEQPEQVIELYRNDAQLMAGLQSRVMEEQVIDWIADRAQHTEQALSFQQAIGQ